MSEPMSEEQLWALDVERAPFSVKGQLIDEIHRLRAEREKDREAMRLARICFRRSSAYWPEADRILSERLEAGDEP